MLLAPHWLALLLALVLDALLGDPVYSWHPVRLIGLWISRLERDLYPKGGTPGYFQLTGCLLVAGVLSMVFTVYALLARLVALGYDAGTLGFIFATGLEALLIYQLLAARCLWDEGRRIADVLALGDMERARQEIGYLVSRDTKTLSAEAIYKAAVETLTENITDGIVAPLMAYAVAGLPGMALYKAINTMDSMIAYKNERYLYFGRWAAYLDDAANFIAARVAAVLLLVVAALRGDNARSGLACLLQHRRRHSSPNAGCTESVVAGSLGISLSGPTVYFGKVVERPAIGFIKAPIGEGHLKKAMAYVVWATVLAGTLAVLGSWAMGGLYVKL